MRRTQPFRAVVLLGCMTFFLTSLFYLAHDFIPASSRLIGWQANQFVYQPKSKTAGSAPQTLPGAPPSPSPNSNFASELDQTNLPSYPLDAYAPLLANPAPLTEIAVKSCLPLTSCSPKSTQQQDTLLGKWVKVDRALDPSVAFGESSGGVIAGLFSTFEQRHIFYRKSMRLDVPRVVEIKLVETGQPKPKGVGWHRAKNNLRTKYMRLWGGSKGLHLYYMTRGGSSTEDEAQDGIEESRDDHVDGRATKRQGPPPVEAITELDVTYGDNPPWPGFEPAGVIVKENRALGQSRTTLTFRRMPSRVPPASPPPFKKDGTFKILQLADLHFSVNPEPCRDVKKKDCVAKNDTLAMIDSWLDKERPDMVVLTGDQLNGQSTSWDERSVLSLVTAALIKRKLPWAAIFGNHDSESGPMSREEQMHTVQNMPYSLTMTGPSNIHGTGNYYLKLKSPTPDRTHVFTLWFLDSGTRAPKDPWKPWNKPGYDWIRKDQVDWFVKKWEGIKDTLLPYQPDGGEDLGPQWIKRAGEEEEQMRRSGSSRRRSISSSRARTEMRPRRLASEGSVQDRDQEVKGKPSDKEWQASADQGRRLGKPPSIIFTHIPVPEAFSPVDLDENGRQLIFGSREETATAKGGQSSKGIFDAALGINAKVKVSEEAEGGVRAKLYGGIKMFVHGHMHLNEDCRRVRGIWICFGGGSSLAGYGKIGIKRRSRVIEISEWGQKLKSWHLLELDPQRVDEVMLPTP
ncbi:hypothetical protein IE53DRAFT_270919 [Violaceomyces palustris]|uniref:Uncharacterized protein n=1 Tax=Violaceomyces palustris TaxID=1673888 RepID=A0ACD0NMW4_9BASI|nr:hypothetical protein IE53DRAFT_270919 [Violaceomyces palustris]